MLRERKSNSVLYPDTLYNWHETIKRYQAKQRIIFFSMEVNEMLNSFLKIAQSINQ